VLSGFAPLQSNSTSAPVVKLIGYFDLPLRTESVQSDIFYTSGFFLYSYYDYYDQNIRTQGKLLGRRDIGDPPCSGLKVQSWKALDLHDFYTFTQTAPMRAGKEGPVKLKLRFQGQTVSTFTLLLPKHELYPTGSTSGQGFVEPSAITKQYLVCRIRRMKTNQEYGCKQTISTTPASSTVDFTITSTTPLPAGEDHVLTIEQRSNQADK